MDRPFPLIVYAVACLSVSFICCNLIYYYVNPLLPRRKLLGYSYYLESTLKCIFIFKRLCETRAGGQRDTGGRILHTPLDRNLHCLVYRVLLAGPYHCSICYYRRDIPKEPLAGRNSHAKGLTILIRRGQSRSKEGRKEGRNPSVTCLRKRECCWKAAKQSDGADTVNAGHAWRPVSFKVFVPHNGC